jgi:uncharacterized membrane protein YkvA (DUF1232 family)
MMRAMGDPFPRERFLALVRRTPAYARLAWRLGHDPKLSRARRASLVGAVAYLASPIDLVPGVIPLAGQLDDAAVVLLALRGALRGLPLSAQEAHLAATGLRAVDLDEDLDTLRRCAAWLARRGARLGWSLSRSAGRGVIRAAAASLGWAARRMRRGRESLRG